MLWVKGNGHRMEHYRTDPGKKEQGKMKDTECIKRLNSGKRPQFLSHQHSLHPVLLRKKQRPVGTTASEWSTQSFRIIWKETIK